MPDSDGKGEDVFLPRKRKLPDKHQVTQITMIGAAHKATASAKAAADAGAATAARMITVQVASRKTVDNVHIALKRTKYAAAAAANKVAAAGWNMRIGTVAYIRVPGMDDLNNFKLNNEHDRRSCRQYCGICTTHQRE
jgi:hypothetical protein